MDYSLGDVARILKVSPRRLRYWQQTNLISSDTQENGSERDDLDGDHGAHAPADSASTLAIKSQGGHPDDDESHYAFRDLVVLRAIVSLVDKGIPLQRIRRNLELLRDRLPDLDDPAAALRLLDEDSRRLVVRHDGRLEEAGGQLILEFGGVEAGEAAAVAALSDFDSGSSVDAASEAALSFFEQGCELDADPARWAEAIEAYESALEADPEYADAYCNLGAVRYNQGQRAEARRAFEACLAREADHVEANFNLANVLEEEGDDRAALAHYRRALASDPLYPDLHINLALLYEKLGRTRPACDHWRRYLQLDPDGTWAEVARLRLERASDQA